jgi:hypothetical protein
VKNVVLSEPLMKVWSMVLDNEGNLFISGTGASGPGAHFVVHKYDFSGAWQKSFGEASHDFPDVMERFYGDAGPLWFDPRTKTIWFSRGGPRFEMIQFTPEGQILRRVRFSDGVLPTWRSRIQQAQNPTGQLTVSAKSRIGSISLLPLTGDFLVNVTLVDDDQRMRYDVFRLRDGKPVARWFEKSGSGFIGLGDGNGWVFRFNPSDSLGVFRQRVSFSVQDQ